MSKSPISLSRVLILTLAAIVSVVFVRAIGFLSTADSELFYKDYWITGMVHKLFFETQFWQTKILSQYFDPSMFLHVPSLLWVLASGVLLFLLREVLSLRQFVLLGVICLITPYLLGLLYFQLFDVALNASGPVVAFMWLPIAWGTFPLALAVVMSLESKQYRHTAV